jgi:hypothetical protein
MEQMHQDTMEGEESGDRTIFSIPRMDGMTDIFGKAVPPTEYRPDLCQTSQTEKDAISLKSDPLDA